MKIDKLLKKKYKLHRLGNEGWPLKRHLDKWDQTGSTSDLAPWQLNAVDDSIHFKKLTNSLYCFCKIKAIKYQSDISSQVKHASTWAFSSSSYSSNLNLTAYKWRSLTVFNVTLHKVIY